MATFYMLCSYEEHGPEHIALTDDRAMLPAMLEEYLGVCASEARGDYQAKRAAEMALKYREELTRRLALSDKDMDEERGPDLLCEWGGLQLYVLTLWNART